MKKTQLLKCILITACIHLCCIGYADESFFGKLRSYWDFSVSVTNAGYTSKKGNTIYYSGTTATVNAWSYDSSNDDDNMDHNYWGNVWLYNASGTQIAYSGLNRTDWFVLGTLSGDGRVLFNSDGHEKEWDFLKWHWNDYSQDDTYYIKRDTTAPSVVFNPASIIYTKNPSQSCTAVVSDSLSGVNAVSSPSGGTVSEDKTIAQQTFNTEGKHTFSVTASDNVNNTVTQTQTVYIDWTSPVFSGIADSSDGSWVKQATVTASATDSLSGIDTASWQYSLNGGATWSEKSSANNQVTVNQDGVHFVMFKVSDKAGNSAISETKTIKIDVRSPEISITGPIDGQWVQFATITAVAKDIASGINTASFQYSTDGGSTWLSGSTATLTVSGMYSVCFKVNDIVGNAAVSEKKTVKIDTTKPSITISNPASSSSVLSATISASAADAHSGIDENSWKYTVDGGTKKTGNTVTVNTHGVHTVVFFVTDTAGNTASFSASITIDAEGPVIRLMKEPTSEWAREVQVRAISDDADTDTSSWQHQIQYKGNPSAETGTGSSAVLTAHGQADVFFTVQDVLGNTSTSSILRVNIDRKAPVIRSEYTLEGSRFTVYADDADSGVDTASYKYRLAGEPVYKDGQSAVLPEGNNIQIQFTVSDNAGNVSTERSFAVTVDTVAPVLSCTTSPYMKNGTLALTDFYAQDATTGLKRLSYQLDGNSAWTAITKDKEMYAGDTVLIPLPDIQEGSHTLRIKAEDFAGNYTETPEYRFISDKTPPQILDTTEFLSDGKILKTGDFTGAQPLQITVQSSDTYKDSGRTETGTVAEWHAGISVIEGVPPAKWKIQNSNIFILNDETQPLSNGVNYIYIRVTDGGGNISTSAVREIIKDTAGPGKPVINSSTHKKAYKSTDTEIAGTAVFSIRPQTTAEAGLSGYVWQLQTCRDSAGTDTDIRPFNDMEYQTVSETGLLTLSFDLPDNEQDEFYRLEAACIGGNGITGAASGFRFRIDSVPPEGLYVSLSSQTESERWYNAADVHVRWNKPADKTGIATYTLSAADETDAVLKRVLLNAAEYTLSAAELDSLSSGQTFTIHVDASDYSGNTVRSSRSFKIDMEKPAFSSGIQIRELAEQPETGRIIEWGALQDVISGSDYIILQLTGLTENDTSVRNITVSGDTTEYTFKTLKKDAAYHVTVKGFDTAGNFAVLTANFTTGNAQIPETVRILYDENIGGYRITGTLEQSTLGEALTGGRIDISDSIDIKESRIIDGIQTEKKISFFNFEDEHTELSDSLVTYAQSSSGMYTIKLNGFELHGSRLLFDRNSGLIIEDISYIRKIQTEADTVSDYTVQFNEAVLGFPSSASIRTPLSVQNTAVTAKTGGFDIRNVQGIQISGSKEMLSGTAGEPAAFTPKKIDIRRADGSRRIPLQTVLVNADGSDAAAKVPDSDILLRMNNTDFTVIHSGISGSRYEVYEAVLKLPEGYQIDEESGSSDLIIKNFSIDDTTGIVSEEIDFAAGKITYRTPDGREIIIDRISLGSDGTVYGAGSVDAGVYGSMSMTGLVLTNTGADLANGCPVPGFETTVHGFQVKASAVKYTASGILVENGTIRIYDTDRNIHNLGLDISGRSKIYRTGTVSSVFTADTGYGRPILIDHVYVEQSGVYAGTAQVPLPYGNEHTWNFTRTQLYPDGSCRGTSDIQMQISLGGYGLAAVRTIFAGNEIHIDTGLIQTRVPFNTETLQIKDVSFNAQLLISGGTIPEEKRGAYSYAAGEWTFIYDTISVAEDGLHGAGCLYEYTDTETDGWIIFFHDFVTKADGTFESGKSSSAADENIWIKNGYYIYLPESVLEKTDTNEYVLQCVKPEISLAPYADAVLYGGKIVVDSKGNILSTEKNASAVNFTAANRYRVIAESAEITEDGVMIDGTIAPESWSGAARTAGKRILLKPSLSVSFEDEHAQITYEYTGWTVSGSGISFTEYAAKVAENKIEYRGQLIELGTLSFMPKGLLKEEQIKTQLIYIPLVSERSQILETAVDSKGIRAAMNIALPLQFGDQEMPYRNVRLYPDGSFRPADAINHISIDLGTVIFDLKHILLTEDGLEIAEAAVILPTLDNVSVKLRGLVFGNGSVSLKGAAVSPFTLWNMTFSVSDISFFDDEISIEGSVTLPKSLPGILSERTVGIRKMRIGFNGCVREFEARLEGSYVVPFLENWALRVAGIGVGYANDSPYIGFDEAGLIFPAGFIVDTVAIDNVVFDPVKQMFDFERIKADTRIHLEKCGIVFDLTQLSIKKDMTVGFAGSVTFAAEELPTFIKGKSVVIDTFEIKKDGSLGEISIALDGLDGEIIPSLKALELRDGSVKVEKNNSGNLYLSVSGGLEFTEAAPEFVRNISSTPGTVLLIENFTIDTSVPEITDLSARLSRKMQNGSWSRKPEEINFDPVLFGTQLNDIYISFDWESRTNTGLIALAGGLILPNSLPEGMAGTEIRLKTFEIGMDGSIQAFAAAYSLESTKIAALDLTDVSLLAEYKGGTVEFDVGATMTLSESQFPKGIGGISTKARFIFTPEQLKTAQAYCSVPNQKLMDSLYMHGVSFSLDKQYGTDLMISLTGGLTLPDNFPQGLAGTDVMIRNFTISASGTIQNVDIGATNINAVIFSGLRLSEGRIDFANGTDNDLEINVQGTLAFISNDLPEGLKNTAFAIDELRFSTKTGLKTFTAGMNSSLSFNILGGLDFSVYKLRFSERGFSVAAGVRINVNSVALASTEFALSNFEMDWNGKIIDIQGGLKKTAVSVAGFTGSIQELYVLKDPQQGFMIALKECRITMPDNFGSNGGASVALKNATFNPKTGAFNGDIEVPQLTTEIAGFTLILKAPTINFNKGRVEFSEVKLKMPEFMKAAEVSLYNVEISASSGFKFGGGGFTLPDFRVGEIGFKNVGAEFSIDGSTYMISGHGGAMIPGAGIIEAKLSFTNVSSTYPIGLKHAYFSYETYVGGIPLGTTGLCLSGIRGGLAYGFPDEVPENYRKLFNEKGARIQLGLTVKDQGGGKLVRMDADTWIDMTKIAWVFEGNTTILSGTLNISAKSAAIISNNVFATGMDVRIRFVRGTVEIYIFDHNGSLKFSGSSTVQFGMPRGYLRDGRWIKIPTSDIWFGSIGAMFGDFTNGKRGFLGFIDIKIGWFNLGRVGAFIGSGGLDIKVSSYEILKPEGVDLFGYERFVQSKSIYNADMQYRTAETAGQSYRVIIPGAAAVLSGLSDPAMMSPLRYVSGIAAAKRSASENVQEAPERVIFIVEYLEGDPDFTITAPSGTVFKPGDDSVETSYCENGMFIAVQSPESGEWKLTMDNIDEGSYGIAVLGVEKVPEISLEEPSSGVTVISDTMYVSGKTDTPDADICVFAAEDELKPALEIGRLKADGSGYFAGSVSTEHIADGEYVLTARVIMNDGLYSPAAVSAGRYKIDRSAAAMQPPSRLRIAETDTGIVKLSWENTNGARTAGYYLISRSSDTGEETKENIGNITGITIGGYQPGTDVSFAVSAYDSTGRESLVSGSVSVKTGAEKPDWNKPAAIRNVLQVTVTPGQTGLVSVPVRIENRYDTGDSLSYVLARQKPAEKDIPAEVLFAPAQYITDTQLSLPVSVFADDTCPAGLYTIECEVVNEGNGILADSFVIEVTVETPQPEIVRIEPGTVSGLTEQTVSVFGNGFIPGTRYYFDGTEISVTGSASDGLSLKTLTIPASLNGGTKLLTITGPGGKTVSAPIIVQVPGWTVSVYTAAAAVHAGDTAAYPVKINGEEGFTGKAVFEVKSSGPGFAVTAPQLYANESGYIYIRVPESCSAGVYTTVISGGKDKEFTLTTTVTQDIVQPVITSVTPGTGFAGTSVSVFGYGFGTGGTLCWNGTEIAVSSWQDHTVTAVLPERILKGRGKLTVKTGGTESNAVTFTVRDSGFTIRSGTDTIKLDAKETTAEQLFINGYAENVSLTVSADPDAPFSAELNTYKIIPNGTVQLSVTPHANAPNGRWSVTVSGTGSSYTAELTLTVEMRNSFAVLTDTLPGGACGLPYQVQLEYANTAERVYWKVSGGALPQGLELSSAGQISGTPVKKGISTVSVTAYTAGGKQTSAQYTVLIADDMWSHNSKNGGRTKSSVSDIPSTDAVFRTVTAEQPITDIYVQSDRTVLVSDTMITALDSNGYLFWTDRTAYTDSFINESVFAGLDVSDRLTVRTLSTGLAVWSRENVKRMWSDGTVIITQEPDSWYILDAAAGTVKEKRNDLNIGSGTVLWNNGNAWEISDSGLTCVYGQNLRWTAPSPVRTAVCDAFGFVVLTEQSVIILDHNLNETGRIETYLSEKAAAGLDTHRISVLDGTVLTEYDRGTLEPLWICSGVTDFAAANEKTAAAGSDQLRVVNRYSGQDIWKDAGNVSAIAVYDTKLYAARGAELTIYNGDTNASAPETGIRYTIAEPDGTNGWYKTLPEMYVRSIDAESYVDEIRCRQDNGIWTVYTQPIPVQEGYTTFEAYGTDSRGLKGKPDTSAIKADSTAPVSTVKLYGTETDSGWYTSDVYVSIDAYDTLSGIAYIKAGNKQYAGTIVYKEEGDHILTVQAADKAGNTESEQKLVIRIDKYEPYVQASVRNDLGIAVVTLDAQDTGSGVDYIEYSIDGSRPELYTAPVALLEKGQHKIDYRAKDKSGRITSWRSIYPFVNANTVKAGILGLAEVNGEPRAVCYPMQEQMVFFAAETNILLKKPENDFRNLITSLPEYAKGGTYIQWNESDKDLSAEKTASCYVKEDAVIYLFAAEKGSVPEGWTYIENGVRINETWFPEGCTVYMKWAEKGECIQITEKGNESVLPLIVVQEKEALESGIRIRVKDSQQYLECIVTPVKSAAELPLRYEWYLESDNGREQLEMNRTNMISVTDAMIGKTVYAEVKTPDGMLITSSSRIIVKETGAK